MEQFLLVNPRKKRRKGRMPAGLRRYWAARRGKHRVKRRRARMSNPRRRRRSRSMAVAPRRRRRHHKAHRRIRRRARNPIFHRRRKRRHNPFSSGGVMAVLKPAAIGAAGALAMNIGYGYLSPSLPATLTTGYLPVLVKGAAAIGVGMLVGKFMSRQDGMYATVGGLTVVLLGLVTPMLQSAAPTLPGLSGLAGYGDYIPMRMGAYSPSLARNANSRFGRLGFISPAPKVGMGAYMGRGMAGVSSDLSGSGFDGLSHAG
jgi:hypothetical protein